MFLKIGSLPSYRYPEDFLRFSDIQPEPDIEPWWLLSYTEDLVDSWHQILKTLYPQRSLIPSAKFNANDDIACFDGDDESANPEVLIIHAYASTGWELHEIYPSFEEWLKKAYEAHRLWEAES